MKHETKHTPGPWKAHKGWADPELNIDAGEYPHWCEVTGPEGPSGNQLSINGHFGMGNASLIAAAPELLNALKEIEDLPAVPFSRDPVVMATRTIERIQEIARAAIAKATGEQP